MRGLFFKIFAIFWLAQSLIFIISTALIVRQRFPSPNTVSDALDSNLRHDATMALQDFETGGCAAFRDNARRHEPSGATLLDSSGQTVCATSTAPGLSSLGRQIPDRIDGRELGGHYIWLIPIAGNNGTHYIYVWHQPPSTGRTGRRWNLLHFAFPQLPVAIAVGGLTTFVLVLLFSRPLVRMRKAARALAGGNLSARVEQYGSGALQSHSDEFQGLVHDFNHMAERLESLVDAQKLLLRDVSHELRSPLSRLSVALELAREDATPELNQHLARIEREAEKLNQLIGQLLTLSSMEARENTSTFQPISLNDLCRQMLPDAEYEARQRSCTVLLNEDNDCVIRGDYELLYRAVENVVRNAIRYTDPGTQVTVRIAEVTIDAKRFASLEINDQGPGIPEAELAHIFRPFYRLDYARSSGTGGFGVGLAITERAVRLHGGTVSASNRADGGTSIVFLFPTYERSESTHADPRRGRKEVNASSTTLNADK
jgi:two-component system sensor histidine kinase CpxA